MEKCELILGDCLEKLKQIPDKSVDAVVTDPPYNLGIDKWDRVKDYHNWLLKVFKECERVLKDNGTLWFFHTKFNDLSILHELISRKTQFRHKQLVIIDKGLQSVAGRTSEALRSFPKATEYLQFYTFEDTTGLQNIYSSKDCFTEIKNYLRTEKKKSGMSNKQISNIFSDYTNKKGCLDRSVIEHYFQTSQWIFPTKELYNNVLRKTGYFNKPYEELREQYEELRYTFNSMIGFTDVWKINFYKEKKFGHITQKPQVLMERIIKTCSNQEKIVVDPFMGSGSTGVACANLNRNFIGIELDPQYFKIAEKRIKEATEQQKLF